MGIIKFSLYVNAYAIYLQSDLNRGNQAQTSRLVFATYSYSLLVLFLWGKHAPTSSR